MDDDTIKEAAGAVKEAAKATGQVAELADHASGFLNKVFGDLVVDGVGLAADRLKFYRTELFLDYKDRVEKLFAEKGIAAFVPIPPRLALPILEAATVEEREDLQDLWAGLTANYMDPKYQGERRTAFASVLRELEPVDAQVLGHIRKFGKPPHAVDRMRHKKLDGPAIALLLGLDTRSSEAWLSLNNLVRLGVLEMEFEKIQVPDPDASQNDPLRLMPQFHLIDTRSPTGKYELTEFGLHLILATVPET